MSDDRRFLALLAMWDIPFLTPAHCVVLLARRGIVAIEETKEALERLRPLILMAAYQEAREDLEHGSKS